MNIVSYGSRVDSTSMLAGLHPKGIPVDLILFTDTGGELPSTYAYLPVINQWLISYGMPTITVVTYTDKNGDRLTLEQECLRSGTLPALAYGYKKCSLKHKIGPQDKFCNHYPPCRESRTLYHQHRDLYDRAIAIENDAIPNLTSIKSLDRDWSWQTFVEADKNQVALCGLFPETDMPCGCYDG